MESELAARAEEQLQRVVAHVDMDCFYCQVERRRDPSLVGVPVAVTQYNPQGDTSDLPPEANRRLDCRDSAIIAVSYEARKDKVSRVMRSREAREKCPGIQFVQVPVSCGKADISIYRDAGAEVVQVLQRFSDAVERSSIDEVYLDVTSRAEQLLAGVNDNDSLSSLPNTSDVTFVAGTGSGDSSEVMSGSEQRRCNVSGMGSSADGNSKQWWGRTIGSCSRPDALLAAGCAVVALARQAVLKEVGFTCSAGLAHCKLLAKLGSGMRKPNGQTCIPSGRTCEELLRRLPIERLRGLGGKLGDTLKQRFGASMAGDVEKIPLRQLCELFGPSDKTGGPFVWLTCRGIDAQGVKDRALAKSRGCGKNFKGAYELRTEDAVRRWAGALGSQLQTLLVQDLTEHGRVPGSMVVSFSSSSGHISRTVAFPETGDAGEMGGSDMHERLVRAAVQAVRSATKGVYGLRTLYLTGTNFRPVHGSGATPGLKSFFSAAAEKKHDRSNAGSTSETLKAKEPASGIQRYFRSGAAASGEAGMEKGLDVERGSSASSKGGGLAQIFSQPRSSRQWSVNPAEVDMAVLSELPEDVRREILQGMHKTEPSTQAPRNKRAKMSVVSMFNKH